MKLSVACMIVVLGLTQVDAFSPAPVAQLGERCGGGTADAKECGLGLYCRYNRPNRPGASGTCKRGLKQGDRCDRSSVPCGRGLVCQRSSNRRSRCEKPVAKQGQSCGGGTLDAMACDKGLYCYYEQVNLPGAPGVCRRGGKEGDRCLAFTNPPQPPCADGFQCILTDPRLPDLGGKCREYRVL